MPEHRQRRELAFHPDIFGVPAPFRAVHPPREVPDDESDGGREHEQQDEPPTTPR